MSEETPTSREKLMKHCTVTKEQGRRGDVLIYGKHKYRMSRNLANLTEEECDKVVKVIELDAYIATLKERKATQASKRKPKADVIKIEARLCECGCKAMAKPERMFLPGHDAKLKSRLRKAAEDGDAKAIAELKARGW